ncbi:MAG TPA: ABC transporter ATP-binding protein [Beutenbergiaceae bacterium]|nr:ABC transporter ATP-binding protein [Beutenbergiaceae bacterium]
MTSPQHQLKEPDDGARAVLEVDDLQVTFSKGGGKVHAVNGISYTAFAGQTLAIIGESGSGKSVSVRALMGLLPDTAFVSGSAKIEGKELVGISPREMRQVRGSEIAMVFQDPARSLNPTMTIGAQITEAVRTHKPVTKKASKTRVIELLKLVKMPAAERRFHEYPHQLSGGMRQRAMIAIALASDPKVLIADEATTALDVTTQAQIMELLLDLQEKLGTAVILISHDLGLAASYADHVFVMYAGKIVEYAPAAQLFHNVRMPYTDALLGAIPKLSDPPHTELTVIGGHPPDLSELPQGCSFAARCPRVTEQCRQITPVLRSEEPGHEFACHNPVPSRDAVAATAEGAET